MVLIAFNPYAAGRVFLTSLILLLTLCAQLHLSGLCRLLHFIIILTSFSLEYVAGNPYKYDHAAMYQFTGIVDFVQFAGKVANHRTANLQNYGIDPEDSIASSSSYFLDTSLLAFSSDFSSLNAKSKRQNDER